MSHWIVYALLIFVLLRILRKVVFPMFQITRIATDKMRDMQRQMEEMERKNVQQEQQKRTRSVKEGEFIDFEEVK
jgi:membrane protein insertase Oxa1/YidC/SpoIIIJ